MAIDFNPPTPDRSALASAPGAPPAWRVQLNALFAPKVGTRERMLFTERLLLLLETGVSLHEGLRELRLQEANPRVAQVIDSLVNSLLDGQPLSEALAREPGMFPVTYVNLVSAGERGGFLPQVLQQLLELDEKNDKLRSMLVSALSYPAFLIFFSMATIVFVLVGVFPKFAVLFERIRDELPWTTRVLMSASDLLRLQWPWVLSTLAVLLVAGIYWLQQPLTRGRIDGLKLSLPGLREIFVQIYLSQTLRVLGMSLSHGVPLVDALRACQDLVGNTVFQRFMIELRQRVTEGSGIAVGFGDAPFVPPMVRQMIRTGEETGSLAKVMSRVADFYDRELARRLAIATRLVEPVMLLVMGALVGLIVASLILPIFKLSRSIH
jgi:type II secretory pathway component PulF